MGIDIIGPLQKSAKGNKYIVAVTDHFSKWSEAAAIPDKSAASVASFLYSVVCRLGCMETLISDQGREFVNQVIDKLMAHLQSEHRISSPYHPQTNGQRERDNRTLKDALCKLVDEEGTNWDDFIQGVLFAYHTSVHASTRYTPFEVMYGHKARLPIDLPHDKTQTDQNASLGEEGSAGMDATQDMVETLHGIKRDLVNIVADNIKAAQSRQKENFDKRHHSSQTISVGAIVYIKNNKRIHRMGSKMEPRWTGPYAVAASLGKGRVKLMNQKTGTVLKCTHHISNLKLYCDPESSETHCEAQDEPEEPPSKRQKIDSDYEAQPGQPLDAQQEEHDGASEPQSEGLSEEHPRRYFKPVPGCQRRTMAEALSLTVHKQISMGKQSELKAPRRIHRTKGDGNCFFRCISHLLTGSEEQHSMVRDVVVTHMSSKSVDQKLRSYACEEMGEYLSRSRMEDDGTWATDVEILATANLLAYDIYIYTKVGTDMRWMRYPATFSLKEASEVCFYIENRSDHFNVVLSV